MTFWTKRNTSLFILAALLIPLIVFFPQILSTTVGKRFVLQSISSKTGAKAEIDKLHLSWFGPQQISNLTLQGTDFQGRVANAQADIPLWKLKGLLNPENLLTLRGNFNLQGGSFNLQSPDLPETTLSDVNASFRLHEGTVDFTTGGNTAQGQESGSFSLQGQINHRFLESVPDFSIRGEILSFPTIALARYLAASHNFNESALLEIIGPSLGLKGAVSQKDQSGSCDLSLHSPNIDVELSGNLNKAILMLRDPLRTTLRLTPALAQRLLSAVNPMFLTGIEAQNPIQLRIEPNQFRFAFELPFHWSNLQIGKATLDVGRIRCANGSTLGALISFLKNGSLSRTKTMDIWFTPLFFKLENGLMQTGRMDALAANSVRFCTWGNINLAKDKLDMVLGLMAETLRSAFSLKQISDDYVLKIPITGSIQQPKLNIGAGAAKIAALVAAQRTPAGGLLNIFLQPEGDVPKPNKPFPWE